MPRRNLRRKPMSEINVVPYIDVSLVLLVIFMITAPLLQTGVEVDLPQAETKTIEQPETSPIIITINKSGQYFIDIGAQTDEPVAAEDLLYRVAAVLKIKPETPVFIRGDAEVHYGAVVAAMAALKNAGVNGVGLMTQPIQ